MTDIIIVEDDPNASAILEMLLDETEIETRVLAICETVVDAVKQINKLKPDLIFLDINLPDGLGFDVLSRTDNHDYKVVFTTVNTEFAIKAFEISALHYIVKPYSIEQIEDALQRYQLQMGISSNKEIIEFVGQALNNKIEKLVLPVNNAFSVFNLKDIIRIEANGSYAEFYIKPSLKVLSSRSIKFYEELFEKSDFIRVHNQHIININHIKKIIKGKTYQIIMDDNTEISVSAARKNELNEALKSKLYFG